jgi:hypothetical protein
MQVKVTSKPAELFPSQSILTILGTFGDVTNTIECAQLHVDRLRDFSAAGA